MSNLKNDLFIRACFGQPVERTPVWMMRQAGRYMEQYRQVRKQHDFWTVCRTPQLACQVTMQPVEHLGVDAAILFSDILVGLPAMGCNVEFKPGPKIENPVRCRGDIDSLKIPNPTKDLGYVLDAIVAIKEALDGSIPLIGFGGAPLTLAAYMIEGGGSKDFRYLKSLLYNDPQGARKLLDILVEAQIEFLCAQIEAGAQAIQIFDTWAGILSRKNYQEFVLEPVTRLINAVKKPGVPVIYFAKDSVHLMDILASTGADVLSLDDKLSLSDAAKLIGPGPALQGNLDSSILLSSKENIEAGVKRVLSEAPTDRGHIFNLGHGILPSTPVENASFMIESVKRLSKKS